MGLFCIKIMNDLAKRFESISNGYKNNFDVVLSFVKLEKNATFAGHFWIFELFYSAKYSIAGIAKTWANISIFI